MPTLLWLFGIRPIPVKSGFRGTYRQPHICYRSLGYFSLDMSDAEIIAGFLSAETRAQDKAIAELEGQIKAPVIHYVRANSGTRQEAIDLMQEVIVVIYQLVKKPDFVLKATTKLSTLAQSIGRNLWLKVLRDKKKRAGDNIEEGMRNEPVEINTALEGLIDTEQLAAAWRAFEKLGPDCQKLLRMAIKDHKPEEISAEMGYTNEGTVRVKKHKCMEKWKELYRVETKERTLAGDE